MNMCFNILTNTYVYILDIPKAMFTTNSFHSMMYENRMEKLHSSIFGSISRFMRRYNY